MVNYTTAGMRRFFSPSFDTNPDAFCKTVPNLPGEWVCVRVQRGHFGPFFGWVEVSHVIDENTLADVACLECEGDGTLTAIGGTGAKYHFDCPECDGTGECENADEIREKAKARNVIFSTFSGGIWCDVFGNVLDAETELEDGWITFGWLSRYEPAAIAA